VGGTKIEAAALDPSGRITARLRVPAPRHDYAQTLRAIGSLVEALEEQIGGRASIGVGIPGALSPATGLVKNANSTWLIGKPFDRDLAALLERPVRVANDANCFALSEAVDGAGAGAHMVFGVILGTGCGGGIVLGRAIHTGLNAIAGEWGHNPLPWPRDGERPGPRCYCGQEGCLETWVSGPGFTAAHARATGERLEPAEIAARAAAGDALAKASVEAYADRLARGLATVVNILDPDVIVLGGGLSQLDFLYSGVPQRLGRYVFSDRVATPIRRPAHGDSSGVRGAAWLWAAEEDAV
jgi:fructokinase